jgi:hypothetical protein
MVYQLQHSQAPPERRAFHIVRVQRIGGHLDTSLSDVQLDIHDPESYGREHT